MALRSDWRTLRDAVLRLIPHWHADELGGFRYLEGGYSNANYRFRYGTDEYVLRMPGKPTAFTDRAREARFYRSLTDLPTAPVLAFDPLTGQMISRWISGRLLADLHPPPQALLNHLRELHRQLDAVGQRDPGLLRHYDPIAQARLFLDHATTPSWLMDFAAQMQWDPPELTLCHNDLNPWNLIQQPDGRWVTLDWEWFGLNDPLFDLVALHQGLALQDTSLTEFGTAFCGLDFDRGRLRNCLLAYWLREFGWANAELADGNQRAEIVAQRELGEARLRELLMGVEG